MLTPSRLTLLTMLLLKRDEERAIEAIASTKTFHPIQVHEEGFSSDIDAERESSEWKTLTDRSAEMARKLSILPTPNPRISIFSLQEADRGLTHYEEKYQLLEREKKFLTNTIAKNRAFLENNKGPISLLRGKNFTHSSLSAIYGAIAEQNLPLLEKKISSYPHIIYPTDKTGRTVKIIILALAKQRASIQQEFIQTGGEILTGLNELARLTPEELSHITEEEKAHTQRIEKINQEIATLSAEVEELLGNINVISAVRTTILRAKNLSATGHATALIAGWIPEQDAQKIELFIHTTVPHAIIELTPAYQAQTPKEEIPVLLSPRRWLAPFRVLLSPYGLPRYGSIDPTIFLGLGFLTLFGIMFSDIGQGALLAFAGLLLARKIPSIAPTGIMVFLSGVSACIFGFLYGSLFGIELHPLWFKPVEHIPDILRLGVTLGACMLILATILNLVNALLDKDWIRFFFDKSGFLAGTAYIFALFAVIAITHNRPLSSFLLAGIIAPIGLLLLKPLAERITGSLQTDMVGSFVESMINILEVFMGYLGNTVSFIRVAAFTLAHGYLFFAFFKLAEIVQASAGRTGSIAIIIAGNLLILVLEGLVVTIQTIRLHYYEFFTRFFQSGNNAYVPLALEGDSQTRYNHHYPVL
ncbi:MAG: V-type ATPase 116kDa subunit family protein [Candidatus Ratteibacteria bacterium]